MATLAAARRRLWEFRSRDGRVVTVATLLVAGALVRFWGIGRQSFWYDEVASTAVIRGSLGHVLAMVKQQEATPPLYYVLAWGWTHVTGISEAGLRSLSAVAGVGAVLMIWACGREAVSPRAGLFAGAVAALNPMLVWFSQEGRAYELVVLLAAGSLYLTIRVWRSPSRGALIGWSVVGCLFILTQYFAVFFLIAEVVVLIRLLPARRRQLAVALTPIVVVGLALVPLARAQEGGGRTAWISGESLGTRLLDVLREIATANASLISSNSAAPGWRWGAVGVAGVVVGWLGILACGRARREPGVRVAAFIAAATIALPLLLTVGPLDYFLDRNLVAAWVALSVAFGGGLALVHRAWIAWVAVVLIAVAGVATTALVQHDPKLQRTNWRAVSQVLGPPRTARAVIFLPADESAVLNYYHQPLGAMPVGARIREIDFVGWGLSRAQAPPSGFSAIRRAVVGGVTVLRFGSRAPFRVSSSLVAQLGASLHLELSPAGARWLAAVASELSRWRRAASNPETSLSRAVLLAARPTMAALAARPPAELPAAPQMLGRLREIADLARTVATAPNPDDEAALRRALAQPL